MRRTPSLSGQPHRRHGCQQHQPGQQRDQFGIRQRPLPLQGQDDGREQQHQQVREGVPAVGERPGNSGDGGAYDMLQKGAKGQCNGRSRNVSRL